MGGLPGDSARQDMPMDINDEERSRCLFGEMKKKGR
jgi:hypothetical protein